jgi:hypothetical protein
VVRPPELRIHAACFIVARLVLVFWVITFIAACSVVSRPVVCLKGTLSCKLQVADVVTSNVAMWVPNSFTWNSDANKKAAWRQE